MKQRGQKNGRRRNNVQQFYTEVNYQKRGFQPRQQEEDALVESPTFEKCLQVIKNNKAPGEDNITIE